MDLFTVFADWFEAQSGDTQFALMAGAGVSVLVLSRVFAKLFGGDK